MVNNFVVGIRMQKCRGATMLEALVSLFVLAIGLLGILGMQAEGTLANQRGMFSSQAALLTQSMANRIRINDAPNSAGESTGRYDNTDTDGQYANANCNTGCNHTQLVAYDQYGWKTELENQLPNGRGAISWKKPIYTISVVWEERVGNDGDNKNRASSIDLTKEQCGAIDPEEGYSCYRLEVRP